MIQRISGGEGAYRSRSSGGLSMISHAGTFKGLLDNGPYDWRRHILARVNINPNTLCWEWTKGITKFGHGRDSGAIKYLGKSSAHQSAWIAYNGYYSNLLHVLHKCCTKHCCNPEHLYLGTAKDNRRDAYKDGTAFMPYNRGEGIGTSKLKIGEVREIRQLYAEGKLSNSRECQIHANKLGVWRHTVRAVITGRNWSKIT